MPGENESITGMDLYSLKEGMNTAENIFKKPNVRDL